MLQSQSKGEAVGVPFQECAETKVRSVSVGARYVCQSGTFEVYVTKIPRYQYSRGDIGGQMLRKNKTKNLSSRVDRISMVLRDIFFFNHTYKPTTDIKLHAL